MEALHAQSILNRAKREVESFAELIARFERNLSILGRSASTFKSYALHIASAALYHAQLPTDIDADQMQDYLYFLQKKSKTPSQTYFKHTVYGLRLLLKTEGLPYSHLLLPVIARDKKIPVILSKEEVWRMLKGCKLLKHRILIGLLYGCGLRCMEARSVRLQDLDFDRKVLHVKQGKGKKDRLVPLSDHLMRGIKQYVAVENPQEWLFHGQPNSRAGGDLDSRYSQRGVQWAVKQAAKNAGILKDVHVHTLRHCYATHLLEDGLDILTLQKLLGHVNIETTMAYLHIAQLENNRAFSPLDTLFAQCSPASKLPK